MNNRTKGKAIQSSCLAFPSAIWSASTRTNATVKIPLREANSNFSVALFCREFNLKFDANYFEYVAAVETFYFLFSSSPCRHALCCMKKQKLKKKKKNPQQVVIIFYICFVQVHVKYTGWRLWLLLYAWTVSWTLAVVNLRHELFMMSYVSINVVWSRHQLFKHKKCLMCTFLRFSGLHRLHILIREVSAWPLTFAHSELIPWGQTQVWSCDFFLSYSFLL